MAYHLSKQSYGFCYRIRVPLQIQTIVGSTEIRYSLKTGSIRDAKFKAQQISANVKRLFRILIEKREDNISMTITTTEVKIRPQRGRLWINP